jgi:hypothetical protein
MKAKVFFILCIASIAILFSSFMVREKEATLNSSVDYYLIQSDRYFVSFISNLQKMEALVYIPKSKLADAKSFNISLVPRDQAVILNKRLIDGGSAFIQVYPSGDQSVEGREEISLNFSNLKMITYIKQEQRTSKMALDLGDIKGEHSKVFPKAESVSINALRPEELQVKWGSSVWESYVPVTYNAR